MEEVVRGNAQPRSRAATKERRRLGSGHSSHEPDHPGWRLLGVKLL